MKFKNRSVCLVHVCGVYLYPRCCYECSKDCKSRCLNAPEKCGVLAEWSGDFLEWQNSEIARAIGG